MKSLFVIIVLIAFGLTAKSQYNYNKYNYYVLGLQLGNDVYKYNFDDSKRMVEDPEFNYSFGISGGYYYNWIVEFHGSLNFSSRNLALNWNYPSSPDALQRSYYKLRYINIPLEARINALYLQWMKLNFGAGVMLDFRFIPKEFLTYQDGSEVESIKYWSTKKFTKVLVALPLSLNWKFYINRHYTMQLSGYYYLYANRMHKDYLLSPATAFAARLGFYYEW